MRFQASLPRARAGAQGPVTELSPGLQPGSPSPRGLAMRETWWLKPRLEPHMGFWDWCDSKVILVPTFFPGKVFCTQDSKAPVVVALFSPPLFYKDKCFWGENGFELLRNPNDVLQPVHRKAAPAFTWLIWGQWAGTPPYVKSLLRSYKAQLTGLESFSLLEKHLESIVFAKSHPRSITVSHAMIHTSLTNSKVLFSI